MNKHYERWTPEEEIAALEMRAKHITYQEISEVLGRTVWAVTRKVRDLVNSGVTPQKITHPAPGHTIHRC